MNVHRRTVGDTLKPFGFQLYDPNSTGGLSKVNLTSRALTFRLLLAGSSSPLIDDSTLCSIVSATDGTGQFDGTSLFSTDSISSPGKYHAWIKVWDSTSYQAYDTYPIGHSLEIHFESME